MGHGPGALLDALLQARRVLLSGPRSPDGDSLGACLALQAYLRGSGVDAWVCGAPPPRYQFLPGYSTIVHDDAATGPWDFAVVLDGDRLRLTPGFERHFLAAGRRGLIDHHASSDEEGYDLVWLEPDATSTCEMVYRALLARGATLTRDQAVQLHTGSVFDTGSFRYSNTTPETLRMAAHLLSMGVDHAGITSRVLTDRRWAALQLAARLQAGAVRLLDGRLILARCPLALQRELGTGPDDLEGVIEGLISVIGCEVAALLQERTNATKVSFRSRGTVDVARVARDLAPTGGGHVKAAGCLSPEPLAAVEPRLIELVRAALE